MRTQRRLSHLLRSVAAVLGVLAIGPVVDALAQTPTPAPAPKSQQQPEASPPAEHPPQAAIPAAPKSPLDRAPKTAEDKSRLLADLYAHLATAEDEAQAKKISERIERMWLVSGSDTVDLLMERSSKAIKQKKFEHAEKLLDFIIALAPDYPEGFNRRAYLNFTQNKYQSAVGDLRRVLALEPNHYKALEGLAQIWRETDNKRGALQVMRQILDINPFASGAKSAFDELKREVEGQGI